MSGKVDKDVRYLALFNSLPVTDYDTLSTALMSIIDNKFDQSRPVVLQHAEDLETLGHLERACLEETLVLEPVKSRDRVLKKMTDVILFCSSKDPSLFKELSPYRDKGVRVYFIVQE